jgi:hypothetical protein
MQDEEFRECVYASRVASPRSGRPANKTKNRVPPFEHADYVLMGITVSLWEGVSHLVHGVRPRAVNIQQILLIRSAPVFSELVPDFVYGVAQKRKKVFVVEPSLGEPTS